jgi:predicted nucleic acid-binding protein
MAQQSKCSTYDLEYVWIARELDLLLVTADAEILKAYPEIATSMESFASDK